MSYIDHRFAAFDASASMAVMAEELIEGGDDTEPAGWQRWLGWGAAALVVVALAGLVLAFALSNRQRDDALAEQRRGFEVMIAVRNIEGQIASAEAVLGRAVIATDKPLAVQYYDQWRRIGYSIERLDRMTDREGGQAARVDELRRLFRARGDELAQAALHLNYNQGFKALSVYFGAGKSDTLPRIRDVLRAIVDAEQVLLTARIGRADDLMAQANRLASVLSLLGMLLLVGLIGLGWATLEAFRRGRRARLDAAFESQRAEALEAAVTERTGELELANRRLLAEASERAHAEAQLRQIQKMEAVGQLTGGIAHDFNNMLAVVSGGLELAKRRLKSRPGDAERHIDNAMEGANRAAALTRRLLAFARSEPLLPQAVDVAKLVGGMTELMDRTLGERIRLDIDPSGSSWPTWVDRHQLENAILNLAVNARDAMPDGGTLTIRASNCALGPDEVGESVPGEYVRIDVIDTGVGMAPEVLDRVFEPFFTTKPVGKGTGLGLSQLFGFVRQSGGEIGIASEPGHGTTVSLYLPRHTGEVIDRRNEPDAPPPLSIQPQLPGTRRALVVEDDARVLLATVSALEELGFDTPRCSSAEEALAWLEVNPAPDIVVTDVVMPGITGPELIARIAKRRPDVAVLFVTGYAADVEDAEAFRGYHVLRKPFTIAGLEKAIDGALSEPRRAPEAVAAE